MPGPPKAPPEEFHVTPPGICEGYVCVDGKCRSCASDAECQQGGANLKCVRFEDWWGSVCATLSQAERHQSHVITSRPPLVDVDAGPVRVVPVDPKNPRSRPRRP